MMVYGDGENFWIMRYFAWDPYTTKHHKIQELYQIYHIFA
jgi:hypothetical protein